MWQTSSNLSKVSERSHKTSSRLAEASERAMKPDVREDTNVYPKNTVHVMVDVPLEPLENPSVSAEELAEIKHLEE